MHPLSHSSFFHLLPILRYLYRYPNKLTPQKDKSPDAYVTSLSLILEFFRDIRHPFPQLILDNEKSRTAEEFLLSCHVQRSWCGGHWGGANWTGT